LIIHEFVKPKFISIFVCLCPNYFFLVENVIFS
jgi:hypothetical protein